MANYYITTPIYYVTDKPHIGHLYSTVAADIQARYRRQQGDDVHFLTGTDEHGQKMQKEARKAGVTPQELADRVVENYREAWTLYKITYDDFIRTTEERHKKVVRDFIGRLMKTGDVYLSEYEGWYCVPDEAYWTETQVVDGKCPDCGRPVEKLKEESYFFKMSKYQTALVDYIKANPDFIQPESRKNEVLGFVNQGLRDISISRTTITWGIPMPEDANAKKEHKIYVWFDALTNYISALGSEKYDRYWSAARHIVGKDILRFHAVYWPTFLMALGLPLPKQILAHGWLTVANRKIGKSLGNAIDPISLAQEVGVDGLRYFLFREFTFGQDGEYTKELMYRRINADLANDYGNAVSRVCSMILKYGCPAKITETNDIAARVKVAMDGFHFEKALEAIWELVGATNQGIEQTQPWALAKSADPADKTKLQTELARWHAWLRQASEMLLPFIPDSAARALETLGASPAEVKKPSPLFPRLEWKPEAEIPS